MNILDKTLQESIHNRADDVIEKYLFEPNNYATRNDIWLSLYIMLREMDELEDFAIVVDETNNTEERINRNELWIDLTVQPNGATQFFSIPIRVIPS